MTTLADDGTLVSSFASARRRLLAQTENEDDPLTSTFVPRSRLKRLQQSDEIVLELRREPMRLLDERHAWPGRTVHHCSTDKMKNRTVARRQW
jgi:hypothetical protein